MIGRHLRAVAAGGSGDRAAAVSDPAGALPRAGTGPAAPVPAAVARALADAQRFFAGRLAGSWVPGYLAGRGLGGALAGWDLGYAPGGRAALAGHLRGLGHHGAAIEAAGLARAAPGGLADVFSDRAMLAVRGPDGTVAGFIGRARPGGRAPKYLNGPQTAAYRKGELLLGLHQARELLARGAVPVVAEGPFDAIAVTLSGGGRYAGVALCGTAMTAAQAAALAGAGDLASSGVLVALDDDRAGHDGAVKAWHVLRPYTSRTLAAALPPGCDPAQILHDRGPAALRACWREGVRPLADLVTEAWLDTWQRVLDSIGAQVAAMRATAAAIAGTVPPALAAQVAQITGGRPLDLHDPDAATAAGAAVVTVAGVLPADPIRQVCLVAERLGFDHSDRPTQRDRCNLKPGHEPSMQQPAAE